MSFGHNEIQPREFKPIVIKTKDRAQPKPIRKVSKKMGILKKEYAKLRHDFLVAHPYCQHFMTENGIDEEVANKNLGLVLCKRDGEWQWIHVPRSSEIHHKRGRGKYLLDTTTWMGVSSESHRIIHQKTGESYAKSYMEPRR